MLNLDTHILVHALNGEVTQLELKLLKAHEWSISAIVLWELAKLNQLKRIEVDLDDGQLERSLSRIHIWPVDLAVCRELKNLDFESDPADELIAATSIVHKIPLLTRDRVIKGSRRTPFAR